MALPTRMLAGLTVGATLGLAANAWAAGTPWLTWVVEHLTQPLGQVFLRLLFMLVVPLLFSALVVGVCEVDLRHLGRLGVKLIGYTVVVSTIAVLIGLGLVNAFSPGSGLPAALRESTREGALLTVAAPPADPSPVTLIVGLVPDNPVKAAATGDMLGLIVFSLIFGAGLSVTPSPAARSLREAIQGLYDVSLRLIEGVLALAPFGVAALLFTMTARLGIELLGHLAAYVGVVVLGLGLHLFGTYSLSVWLLGGMSPVRFFGDVRLAMATAFSTASSNASLPAALRVAEENLKLPPHVSRFVLTVGSAMNQHGTALFEGVTVLFLAQLYGVEMSLGKQVVVMVICILAGIGTAGVPAGSLPVVAMILGLFGIPPEGIGLILGVDRFLDMCRTTVNVTGDLAAAVYIGRGETDAARAPA